MLEKTGTGCLFMLAVLLGSVVFFMLIILIILLLGKFITIGEKPEPKIEIAYTQKIVSLNDVHNTNVSGSVSGGFLYIDGHIKSEIEFTYSWYSVNQNGEHKLHHAPASISRIFITNEKPRVVVLKRTYNKESEYCKSWWNNFTKIDEIDGECVAFHDCDEEIISYDFYIPEGGVVKKFVLDGKN